MLKLVFSLYACSRSRSRQVPAPTMKTCMKKRTNKSSDWLQIGFRKSSDQIGTGGTENSLCPSIFKSVTPALKEQGAVISRLFHWTESWMLILRRNHRRAVSPSVRLLLNTREVGIIETPSFQIRIHDVRGYSPTSKTTSVGVVLFRVPSSEN